MLKRIFGAKNLPENNEYKWKGLKKIIEEPDMDVLYIVFSKVDVFS